MILHSGTARLIINPKQKKLKNTYFYHMDISLPSSLLTVLNQSFGINKDLFLKTHEAAETITSIRLNPFKPSSLFQNEEPVKWCSF